MHRKKYFSLEEPVLVSNPNQADLLRKLEVVGSIVSKTFENDNKASAHETTLCSRPTFSHRFCDDDPVPNFGFRVHRKTFKFLSERF